MYFLSHKLSVGELENFKNNLNKISSKKYRDLDYASLKTDNRKYLKFYLRETSTSLFFTRIQSVPSVYFSPKFILKIDKHNINKINVRFDRYSTLILLAIIISNIIVYNTSLNIDYPIASLIIIIGSILYVILSIIEYFKSLYLLKSYTINQEKK